MSSLATDHVLMQPQVFSKRKLGVALKHDQCQWVSYEKEFYMYIMSRH